jgi:hypothetical protein
MAGSGIRMLFILVNGAYEPEVAAALERRTSSSMAEPRSVTGTE